MLSERKGFTLIEIVIVLAIAALILVIVFLAIQGAQRSRRDTEQRNAAARLLAQMENFAGNNNGTYPTAAMPAAYLNGIVSTNGAAPAYSSATATTANRMNYSSGVICGTGGATATGNARTVAISFWTESGGAACIDND